MNQTDDEEKIKCPKCGSTQLTAQKRGFSGGKAVAGAVITGGVGLLAGLHGKDKLDIYCMNCGNKWNPKNEFNKAEEQKRSDRITFAKEFLKYCYMGETEYAEQYAREKGLYKNESSFDELKKTLNREVLIHNIIIGIVILLAVAFFVWVVASV